METLVPSDKEIKKAMEALEKEKDWALEAKDLTTHLYATLSTDVHGASWRNEIEIDHHNMGKLHYDILKSMCNHGTDH